MKFWALIGRLKYQKNGPPDDLSSNPYPGGRKTVTVSWEANGQFWDGRRNSVKAQRPKDSNCKV